MNIVNSPFANLLGNTTKRHAWGCLEHTAYSSMYVRSNCLSFFFSSPRLDKVKFWKKIEFDCQFLPAIRFRILRLLPLEIKSWSLKYFFFLNVIMDMARCSSWTWLVVHHWHGSLFITFPSSPKKLLLNKFFVVLIPAHYILCKNTVDGGPQNNVSFRYWTRWERLLCHFKTACVRADRNIRKSDQIFFSIWSVFFYFV